MKLKRSQIVFIEKRLREQGLDYEPLHEDMVDHVCCEVEEWMEKGVGFMDAYNKVLSRFQKRGMRDINKETVSLLTSTTMIWNFLFTALRIFRRNIFYGVIRVVCLALGISVFLVTLIYLHRENSYDTFHPDAQSIYRIGRTVEGKKIAATAFPLARTLRIDYPEYTFTRLFKDRSKTLFKVGDKSFYEEGMAWADEYFLSFFPFEGFKGDPSTALKEPYTVVIEEEVARKYLGRAPQLGDAIEFKWNEVVRPLKITGIIPKWPENMHIRFDILVSFATAELAFPRGILDNWNMNHCYTYVKLPSGHASASFENTFENFVQKHIEDRVKSPFSYLGLLQPLTKIHTEPEVLADYTNTINPVYPRLAVAIGVLVLLITSLNFVTLTVAQFHERSKEVGVRKVIGASRLQIVFQLVFETFVLVVVSSLCGLALLYVFLEIFNLFMLTQLSVSASGIAPLLLVIAVLVLALTVITGLYPAYLFSAQNIMETIHMKRRKQGLALRKILLTAQYVIAATLLSFTFVIYDQIRFVESKSLGYDKEQIVIIPHGRKIRDRPDAFKSKALTHPAIESVSLSIYKPTDVIANTAVVKVHGNEPVTLSFTSIDADFFPTYHIGFVAGKNFENTGMDLSKVFILNETAVRTLGLKDPVGSTLEAEFRTGDPNQPIEKRVGTVIGVVKNVHFESLHNAIKPIVFAVKPYWYFYINIEARKENMAAAIAHLEATWKEMFPELPFEYTFLDSEFERLYRNEQQLAGGLSLMGGLALITTCLGLFGFIRFITQQKTKEVSIRKVLGASMMQISGLFSKEFIVSILIANALSLPGAYYLSRLWLQNFDYRIDLTAIPFFITFVVLTIISVLTVASELVKLMQIDPSKTLRYD